MPDLPTSSQIAIIGAGPAGLMAADILSEHGMSVVIYERMASPARKFLMAGRGGLNITHSEPPARFQFSLFATPSAARAA
jgi:predicted flavoprotein YhiN